MHVNAWSAHAHTHAPITSCVAGVLASAGMAISASGTGRQGVVVGVWGGRTVARAWAGMGVGVLGKRWQVLSVPGGCSRLCCLLDVIASQRKGAACVRGPQLLLHHLCSCSCEAVYAELVAPHQEAKNCLKPLLRRWNWSRQHLTSCART